MRVCHTSIHQTYRQAELAIQEHAAKFELARVNSRCAHGRLTTYTRFHKQPAIDASPDDTHARVSVVNLTHPFNHTLNDTRS